MPGHERRKSVLLESLPPTLGFVVGSFLLAAITDRFGRRRATFAFSMAVAAILTLVASRTATSGAQLGAATAIAGIAAAFGCAGVVMLVGAKPGRAR